MEVDEPNPRDIVVELDHLNNLPKPGKVIVDVPNLQPEKLIVNPPCPNQKPEIFVHQLKPIVIKEKPRNIVVEAGKPQIFRSPPVFIHRKGKVHHLPPNIVLHHQKPLFLTEKVIKVSRPVHKKVFVEKFIKKEYPCKDEIIGRRLVHSKPVPCELPKPKPCDEHVDIHGHLGVDQYGNVELDVDAVSVEEEEA